MSKLPNFIIAGFPKCGSSSLYYYLEEHPDIFLPKQKELHYFIWEELAIKNQGPGDKGYEHYHVKNSQDYSAFYSTAEGHKIIGDSSSSFANYPKSFNKVRNELGDVKVLFVVRDPIKRAYSNYLHLVREDREKECFYTALQLEKDRVDSNYADFWYYLQNSKYYSKIKLCKELFTQVHVVIFEEFIKNPQKGIAEIYDFLEVKSDFVPKSLNSRFNEGGNFSRNIITGILLGENSIKKFFKRYNLAGKNIIALKNRFLLKFKKETPPIDAKAEAYLLEHLKSDIKLLREELGINTEYWHPELNQGKS